MRHSLTILLSGCASRGKSKPKPDYGPMVNVWRGEVNHMLVESGMGNFIGKIRLGVKINENMPPGVGAYCRQLSRYHYLMEGTSATINHAPSRRHEAVHVPQQLARALGLAPGPPRRGVKNPDTHPEWFMNPQGERVYTWKLERYYW